MGREKRRKRNEERAEAALEEMNDDAASTMAEMLERAAAQHPEEIGRDVRLVVIDDSVTPDRKCGTTGKGGN